MKTEEKIENFREKVINYIVNKLDRNLTLTDSDIKLIDVLLNSKKEPDLKETLEQIQKLYKEL